jgi:hypothetical protein
VTTIAFIGAERAQLQQVLQGPSSAARALVLEPDPRTADAMRSRRDWREWIACGRLAVLSGPDYAGGSSVARSFTDLHLAPVVVDPALSVSRQAEVDRARGVIARLAFASKANEGARRGSAGRYLLHTLANVTRLARESDVRALAGLGTGRAAIVVAAGPSLDANVHALASCLDRGIVISCDTAARPLALTGVCPDFIVASDPSQANAAHLAALPAGRSWLVGEGSLHPSAFTGFDRRTFAFRVSTHQPWPWLNSVGLDRGMLATWGSVATSAFSLAVLLDCDPIVFIGADFAFTGNRPYCRGTSFEAQWATWVAGGTTLEAVWETLVAKWPPITAADIHGQPARTASHLVAFRDWLVDQSSAQTDRRIVNATEAGLLHGGRLEQASLPEAVGGRLAIDREDLHRAIRAAHVAGRGNLVRVLMGIDDVLKTGSHPERVAWNAFCEGTVPDTAVDLALKTPDYTAWRLALAAADLAADHHPTADLAAARDAL